MLNNSIGMRVLVTGGSGFIGTNLVQSLVDDGRIVLSIDIVPPRNNDHHKYFKKIDILDFELLSAELKEFQPEIIYHMAARTDLEGGNLSDYAANIAGVENLIRSLKNCSHLKCIVFASSRLVCKIGYEPRGENDYCPDTIYGESKVLGEGIVNSLASKIPCRWLIVRPTSIWGPWFDVPYKNFFLSIIRDHYVHPKIERIYKSFGYVGNAVYEMRKLGEAKSTTLDGRAFYMADYPPIDVINMANLIQKSAGARVIAVVPIPVLRIVATIGDFIKFIGYRNPPLTTFRLNNLLTPMVHDLKPMEGVIGPLPFSLQQGIDKTVGWLKSQGEIN